jgi:hypothetical protein
MDGVIVSLRTDVGRLDLSNPGINMVIGNAMSTDICPFEGDMAELIALVGAAAASNLDDVETYLMNRYGFAM